MQASKGRISAGFRPAANARVSSVDVRLNDPRGDGFEIRVRIADDPVSKPEAIPHFVLSSAAETCTPTYPAEGVGGAFTLFCAHLGSPWLTALKLISKRAAARLRRRARLTSKAGWAPVLEKIERGVCVYRRGRRAARFLWDGVFFLRGIRFFAGSMLRSCFIAFGAPASVGPLTSTYMPG
jgi:hypothetical protein